MTKEYPERRAYRKSPGRQYGSDYDPQHPQSQSRSGRLDASTAGERWSSSYGDTPSRTTSRSSLQLTQRPDPRRTRQLLRQSIIASKSKVLEMEPEEQFEQPAMSFLPSPPVPRQNRLGEDQTRDSDSTLYSNRYPARRPYSDPSPSQRLSESDQAQENVGGKGREGFDENKWDEIDFVVDPDLGYDPLDRRMNAMTGSLADPLARRTTTSSSQVPTSASASAVPAKRVTRRIDHDEDDYDDEDEYEHRKRHGLSRRQLLTGLGIAAVGGTAIAAYELVPKIPQALSDLGVGIEHKIADAYNAGAEAVRKEFLNALDTLEGVSLDVAMGAAELTRVAYDVFASPIVGFLAAAVDDTLMLLLEALKSARHFLASVGQDNVTLQALQKVLEEWVAQASQLPKRIQTFVDTDLSGAQAYLRGLKQKLQDEQKKLNGQLTPTPAPRSTSTPTRTAPSATPTP